MPSERFTHERIGPATTGIQTAVTLVFDEMATERRRLDASVDSSAELEQLKTGCEGRAAALMRSRLPGFYTLARARQDFGVRTGRAR